MVIIARSIWGNDRTFRGVVFAAIRLEYFAELFRSTSLGEGYAVALMRQDGTLLARFPIAGTIGMKAPVSLSFGACKFAICGLPRHQSGRPPITYCRRLSPSDYPVAVITTQSEATAFAGWRTTAITMGLLALS